jgi:hypothetical protein
VTTSVAPAPTQGTDGDDDADDNGDDVAENGDDVYEGPGRV